MIQNQRIVREKAAALIRGLGYAIAIICSLQIASVPVVLVAAYTSFDMPRGLWWLAWAVVYVLTVIVAMKLSRVRLGVVLIFIATMFAFAVTEGSIAKLNQKYRLVNIGSD